MGVVTYLTRHHPDDGYLYTVPDLDESRAARQWPLCPGWAADGRRCRLVYPHPQKEHQS